MKAIKASGRKPSELSAEIEIFPQVLVNAQVAGEKKDIWKHDAEISAAIEKVENEMAGNGRVLIRPSGTEPLVRVMIEGKDIEHIYGLAQDLADLIEKKSK